MLLTFMLLAASTAAISVTLSKGSLFHGVRTWLNGRTGATWRFLGGLISCPYCTSHWVAAITVLLTDRHVIHVSPVVDFAVTTFAMVTLAAPFSWLIYNSYKTMHPLE